MKICVGVLCFLLCVCRFESGSVWEVAKVNDHFFRCAFERKSLSFKQFKFEIDILEQRSEVILLCGRLFVYCRFLCILLVYIGF
jgi:hypothetical protein